MCNDKTLDKPPAPELTAADNDPLPAMWAERNRLEALATEADIARDDSRRDELDEQRIEERMPSIRATTVDGVLDYLTHIPVAAPPGKVIVHNSVRPMRRLGSRGFRAWLADPSAALIVCDCGWAPELPEHYRLKPPSQGAQP